MLALIARRLLIMVPLLLGVVLLTTFMVELMPGDPAQIIAGEGASPELVTQIRHDMRLDEPLYERFGDTVTGIFTGDLGKSPINQVSVWSQIEKTLPITFSIAFVSLVFSVLMGVPAGAWAALHQGRFADRVVSVVASVFQAIPPFVIALVLVIALAVDRSVLPATGYVPFFEDPWEWFRHLLLPCFTLALVPAAGLARQTRGALIDTLEQDYIRAARAKGLRERSVIGKHAAKNAATPVVTVLGLQLGTILGGAVIAELIFAMPGFGQMTLTAVTNRDVILIQGTVLVAAVFVLLVNLLIDVSYGYFTPSTRE